MKVKLEIESTDMDGSVMRTDTIAMMELRDKDYRLMYVEDLSGQGNKTKTTLHLTSGSLRILREGEINSDFLYAEGLEHNTLYGTPYGKIPVTLVTEQFDFMGSSMEVAEDMFHASLKTLPLTFFMSYYVEYSLNIQGAESMPMKVKVNVKPI
ncbi:MAG: DUF1934 family protein [Wujia sp.]